MLYANFEFVQFFLLLGSCISTYSLIREAIAHFAKPYLGEVMQSMPKQAPDPRNTTAGAVGSILQLAMKRLAVVIITIFIGLLFLFSLLVYLVLVYPQQSIFAVIAFACYFILVKSLPLTTKIISIKWTLIRILMIFAYTIFISFILLGIPFSAYIFLFSSATLTGANLIVALIVAIVASVLIYLLFIFTRKGKI